MDYNTTRPAMQMPEYGRTIQSMAESLLTIEDPAKRLKNAEAIIDIMAILNPQLKLTEDYRHKLWDHLYQMTSFKLEVAGSPYEKPNEEELRKRPAPLPYPAKPIKHRHLGGNVEQLLAKAAAEMDEEKREGFTQHIAYFMKLAYANWHKEPVHDDMIKAELANISDGTLQFEPTGGFDVQIDLRQQDTGFGKKKKNNRGNYGGGSGMPQQGQGGGNFKKRKFKNKNKGGI